jgi:hypothetical protein
MLPLLKGSAALGNVAYALGAKPNACVSLTGLSTGYAESFLLGGLPTIVPQRLLTGLTRTAWWPASGRTAEVVATSH